LEMNSQTRAWPPDTAFQAGVVHQRWEKRTAGA
jgi:hypothetical protein